MSTPERSRKRRLPIFPLPDTVFFPETTLPLHVFEPRYCEMVADALAGDRTIGVQLLKPGGENDASGRPAVFEIGCAGRIVEHEPLDDGRSNILLKGLYRYLIGPEITGAAYRVAQVTALPIEPLPDPADGEPGRNEMRQLLSRAVERLAVSVGRPEAASLPLELSDEGLVNEALTRLGLDAEDRYRLLAMDRLNDRYRWTFEHVAAVQRRLDLLAPFRRGTVDPRLN